MSMLHILTVNICLHMCRLYIFEVVCIMDVGAGVLRWKMGQMVFLPQADSAHSGDLLSHTRTGVSREER